MKTSVMRQWRKRIVSVTSVGLLAAVLSTSASALPRDASGNLDLNNNGMPRLSPDQCYATTAVYANGQSSNGVPVAFRLFRDGVKVSEATSALAFQVPGDPYFTFQPGMYQLVAVNNLTPYTAARLILSLSCY
jgi:hypothetical protein